MKNLLVLMMIFSASVPSFSMNKKFADLSSQERRNLAMSMRESADAYSKAKRPQKAKAMYKAAYSLYPVGDFAVQVANVIGTNHSDTNSYKMFMKEGDAYLKQKMYTKAINSFQMAREISVSDEVIRKLVKAYKEDGNETKAKYYDTLLRQMLVAQYDENQSLDETDALAGADIYDPDYVPVAY